MPACASLRPSACSREHFPCRLVVPLALDDVGRPDQSTVNPRHTFLGLAAFRVGVSRGSGGGIGGERIRAAGGLENAGNGDNVSQGCFVREAGKLRGRPLTSAHSVHKPLPNMSEGRHCLLCSGAAGTITLRQRRTGTGSSVLREESHGSGGEGCLFPYGARPWGAGR
jgi:hypothetical protein